MVSLVKNGTRIPCPELDRRINFTDGPDGSLYVDYLGLAACALVSAKRTFGSKIGASLF